VWASDLFLHELSQKNEKASATDLLAGTNHLLGGKKENVQKLGLAQLPNQGEGPAGGFLSCGQKKKKKRIKGK